MPTLNSTLKFLAVAAAIAAGSSTFAAGAKIFVIGGKADDPFWSRVKKGADDAALVVKAVVALSPGSVHRTTTTSAPTPPS